MATMIAQNIKTIPHSAEEEQLQSIGKTLNLPDGFDFSIRQNSRFQLMHVLLLEKKACMRMCSFRPYPALRFRNLYAPGAQYEQNPSFTMSISKTSAPEDALRITWWSAGTFPASQQPN